MPFHESDIHVSAGDRCVTVSWYDAAYPINRATVDLGSIGSSDDWWVNRAIVQVQEQRGSGIGSRLLQLALKKAVELGATRVRVSPGGYNSKPRDQQRFYEKNGFLKQLIKTEYGYVEEIWEWTPER